MSMQDALDQTVQALDPAAVDAALVALARLHAAELDGAAGWRARADKAARQVAEQHGTDSPLYEEIEALRAKLSERTALHGIGGQLRALLVELKATPRARPAEKAATAVGSVGKLAALRAVN